MLEGRKVAGAAHRRTRQSLLHQGSIQYPQMADNLGTVFAQKLSGLCINQTIDARVSGRAREIAQQKYETQSWLQRR